MINDETRRKLEEMGLEDMLHALEIQSTQQSYLSLSFEERFQMLVDYNMPSTDSFVVEEGEKSYGNAYLQPCNP